MSGTLLDKWKLLRTIAFDPALSHADDAVAMVLLDNADAEKKGYSWISRSSIAAVTDLSERTVMRSLDRLVLQGYFDATASRGPGNSQTFRPNYEAIKEIYYAALIAAKKETALSPFTTGEKATAPSEKRRHRCPEKATTLSGKGDNAVSLSLLENPLINPPMNPLVEEEDAHEENFAAEEAWADKEVDRLAEEADFRANFYAREAAWEEKKRARSQPQGFPSAAHYDARNEGAEAATEEEAPPPTPSPSRDAASADPRRFVVTTFFRGDVQSRVGPFNSMEEAQAERARIVRDFPGIDDAWDIEVRYYAAAALPPALPPGSSLQDLRRQASCATPASTPPSRSARSTSCACAPAGGSARCLHRLSGALGQDAER